MLQYLPHLLTFSTTLAVGGSNFAVAIADDRVSKGYSICTRKGCKITKLYDFTSIVYLSIS